MTTRRDDIGYQCFVGAILALAIWMIVNGAVDGVWWLKTLGFLPLGVWHSLMWNARKDSDR